MVYISSPVNPTVKYYNSLSRSKIRARDNVFLIEGDILLRESLAAGVEIVSAMVDDSRMSDVSDIIGQLEKKNIPIYCATSAAIQRASSMETAQCIIAVGRTPQTPKQVNASGRYMVCENMQNPGNAGAILRSAAAFGIDGVIFVGGCDVFSPKVLRGSMGAVYKVPVLSYDQPQEVFDLLNEYGIHSFASTVDPTAKPLTDVVLADGCAVWIGNEGNGLSQAVIEKCESRIYIPMRQNTESLNASVAASIFMWEMSK